ALEPGAGALGIRQADAAPADAESLTDLVHEPLTLRSTCRNRDVGASLCEKSGGAHADRPWTGGDDRAPAFQGPTRALQLGDRGDSRRVGAVRVEHDRHAERPEE